jgi:hypothetical protein
MDNNEKPAAVATLATRPVSAKVRSAMTNEAKPKAAGSQPFLITIAAIQKNSRERLLVQLQLYEGQAILSCRVWYLKDGVLKPSRKGLNCSIRHVAKLADALNDALAEALQQGLLRLETGEPPATDTDRP